VARYGFLVNVYLIAKERDMKRSVVPILFGLAAVATVVMAGDPWVGTWKLNPAKSQAPGGRLPHPSSTNIIEIEGDTMHMMVHQTDAAGNLEHMEYTAAFDGKEYPVKVSPPGPKPYTISFKRINPRTREYVLNMGGMTIKGRDVLSEDGKTFSRIIDGKDTEGNDASVVQVFEKQ
jgi:hypothetical protein